MGTLVHLWQGQSHQIFPKNPTFAAVERVSRVTVKVTLL